MQKSIVIGKDRSYYISFGYPRQSYVACDLIKCGCRVNTFIWVSHRFKCIYFETPKAACTSIKKIFNINPGLYDVARSALSLQEEYDSRIDLSCLSEADKRAFDHGLQGTRHESQSESELFEMYDGNGDDAIRSFPDYFSFMFVRSPYSRVISLWQMFCHSDNLFREEQFCQIYGKSGVGLTLNQFIEVIASKRNHHWNPYYDFYPKKNNLDFVGRLENMADDWKYVMKRLGVEKTLPHENVSRKVKVDVDDDVQRAICDIFFKDYEFFGYDKCAV